MKRAPKLNIRGVKKIIAIIITCTPFEQRHTWEIIQITPAEADRSEGWWWWWWWWWVVGGGWWVVGGGLRINHVFTITLHFWYEKHHLLQSFCIFGSPPKRPPQEAPRRPPDAHKLQNNCKNTWFSENCRGTVGSGRTRPGRAGPGRDGNDNLLLTRFQTRPGKNTPFRGHPSLRF